MPRPRKAKRNKEIVADREGRNEENVAYSFGALAVKYNIGRTTAFDVYYREKEREKRKKVHLT